MLATLSQWNQLSNWSNKRLSLLPPITPVSIYVACSAKLIPPTARTSCPTAPFWGTYGNSLCGRLSGRSWRFCKRGW
jgi:hypothetical protein